MNRIDRLEDISLSYRRRAFTDPRLLALRAGHPEPTQEFFDFDEVVNGKKDDRSFDEAKFARGFSITTGDVFILRYFILRRLTSDMDYMGFVGTGKRTSKKIVDKIARNVGADVQSHPIIKEQLERNDIDERIKIPASWYSEMIEKFVKHMAADNKTRAEQDKNPRYMPGKDFPDIQIDYAADVPGHNINNLPHFPLHQMVFQAALIGPEKILKEDIILVENTLEPNADPKFAIQADTPTWAYIKDDVDIERLSVRKLKEEVEEAWPNILRELKWAITYLDPNWGNASFEIKTDEGLRVAVKSLRRRGLIGMRIRVVFTEEPSGWDRGHAGKERGDSGYTTDAD